jgi:hypothetical protein
MGSVGPYPSIRAEALYARLRSIAARVGLDGEPAAFSRRVDDMVMGRRVRFAPGLDKGDRLLWWDAQRALAFLDGLAPKPAAALRGRLYPGRRFTPAGGEGWRKGAGATSGGGPWSFSCGPWSGRVRYQRSPHAAPPWTSHFRLCELIAFAHIGPRPGTAGSGSDRRSALSASV